MTVQDFYFSPLRIALALLIFLICTSYFGYIISREYLHLIPGAGHSSGWVKGAMPFAFAYGLYMIALTARRLLHRGPAVVIDEAGIRAWSWRGEVRMAWREVERARFENWGRLSLIRRRIGYIVLGSREGARIRIGSGEFRRRDWEAIYRIVRERLSPDVRLGLPPLEMPEEEA